jgi:hypothetical protein
VLVGLAPNKTRLLVVLVVVLVSTLVLIFGPLLSVWCHWWAKMVAPLSILVLVATALAVVVEVKALSAETRHLVSVVLVVPVLPQT